MNILVGGLVDVRRVELPLQPFETGRWELKQVTVTEEYARWSKLRAFMNFSFRHVPAGTYWRLVRKHGKWESVVMSDTPNERLDHSLMIHKAKGNVLVNGLGIGFAVYSCLLKPDVQRVTVVEIDKDICERIGSVYSRIFGNRLNLIQDNALTYCPPKGERYDVVWHDIWDTICEDNLTDMHKLHRKYGRRCDWQGSWARELLEDERRTGRRKGKW